MLIPAQGPTASYWSRKMGYGAGGGRGDTDPCLDLPPPQHVCVIVRASAPSRYDKGPLPYLNSGSCSPLHVPSYLSFPKPSPRIPKSCCPQCPPVPSPPVLAVPPQGPRVALPRAPGRRRTALPLAAHRHRLRPPPSAAATLTGPCGTAPPRPPAPPRAARPGRSCGPGDGDPHMRQPSPRASLTGFGPLLTRGPRTRGELPVPRPRHRAGPVVSLLAPPARSPGLLFVQRCRWQRKPHGGESLTGVRDRPRRRPDGGRGNTPECHKGRSGQDTATPAPRGCLSVLRQHMKHLSKPTCVPSLKHSRLPPHPHRGSCDTPGPLT